MEKLKDGARHTVAGGAAGLAEICILYPLDLVKTRLQVGSQDKGMRDCVVQTFRKEGLSGFYKGILPPILAETPKRAAKFMSFEQYKNILLRLDAPYGLSMAFAGLLTGITESIISCPFELVKVRLQSERNVLLKDQRTSFEMAREIIRTQGMGTNGIHRGLHSMACRNGIWSSIYFGLYHNAKEFLPDQKNHRFSEKKMFIGSSVEIRGSENKTAREPTQLGMQFTYFYNSIVLLNASYLRLLMDKPNQNLFGRILIGFTGGSLASVANIPFDVAKTRIQGPQPDPQHIKYSGTFQTISLVYKEEGLAALYKGLVPKIMRLGPGGAIMLVVYESVYEYLKKHT